MHAVFRLLERNADLIFARALAAGNRAADHYGYNNRDKYPRDPKQRAPVAHTRVKINRRHRNAHPQRDHQLEPARQAARHAKELASNEDMKEFYPGVSSGERKSFHDVKSQRRSKSGLA